jgi:hypothetical protein
MRVQRLWSSAARLCAFGACLFLFVACGGDDGGDKPNPNGTAGTGAVAIPCGSVFCLTGQACINNVCVAGCTLDTECAGGKCCNQQCVDVVSSRENCGACGVTCTAEQQCTAGACVGLTCQTTPPVSNDDAGADDAGVSSGNGSTVGTNGCFTNETCSAGVGGAPTCMCGSSPRCPDGESCTATGACTCGTSSGCFSPQTCCGNACANLQTDLNNCGECGKQCPGDQACLAGSCGCSVTGEMLCGDDCTNVSNDEAHCGTCNTACATGATCNSGECECPAGQIACGGVCVSAADDAHCGACDEECGGPTSCGERVANSGAFECLCPNFNHILCDGTCVSPTQDANCGRCGNVCSGQTDCLQDEETGERDCLCPNQDQTSCDGTCVDLGTDEANCGTCDVTCLQGETCTNGECSCPTAGQKFCDEDASGQTDGAYACISVNTDSNCGGCGEACLGATQCDTTALECECDDASKTYCDGSCKDTKTDEQHCGGCGIVCPANSTCNNGQCSCPNANQKFCETTTGYACIDVASDEANCGACGTTCSATQACCNKACTSITTTTNCGACGTACFPIIGSCNEDNGMYSCGL